MFLTQSERPLKLQHIIIIISLSYLRNARQISA